MSGNTLPDERPKLEGGPRDGARIAKGTRPNFIYVGGPESKPKVFIEPGPSRDLYRLLEQRGRLPIFIFAGHTHRKCEGCGAFVRSKPKCALCGHVERPPEKEPAR